LSTRLKKHGQMLSSLAMHVFVGNEDQARFHLENSVM
jgi:hypothetical protein